MLKEYFGNLPMHNDGTSSSSDTSAGQRFQPHNCTLEVGSFFRVGGGLHDSYTFQCGLVGSFTSPGIAKLFEGELWPNGVIVRKFRNARLYNQQN